MRIMNIFFIMSIEYLNFYNNLIRLTTNKNLYKGLKSQDSFSDRLILFLIHFAFFLKVFKKKENTKILQEIYDFNFRQMELTIREIGYGDQSINKKMKEYINFFHFILLEIRLWDDIKQDEKEKKIASFLSNFEEINNLVEYFDDYNKELSKKTLKSYLNSVISP